MAISPIKMFSGTQKNIIAEQTLNYMYKTLPVGTERKLENFNGLRKISVYRGGKYMNKITRKLTDPQVIFIRCMKNAGTDENPHLVTKSLALNIPNSPEGIEIYFNEPGNSLAGVLINLFRKDFAIKVKEYPSLNELRHDPDIMHVIEKWTGKKLLR